MGLFDIFKNDKEYDSPAKEDFQNSQEQFDAGDYENALKTLSGGFTKDITYKPLYQLSIKVLKILGGDEEAELFSFASKNLNKFEAFNRLGTHFYEVGHYDLALPFLEKAVSIDSTQLDTVHDLSIVYARRFQIQKAIDVLEKSGPENDFWNYWFWCKLRILAGNTEGVKEGLDNLMKGLNEFPNPEEVVIPRQKVEETLEILHRFELLKAPRHDIQDWHFIQYGGVILDYFDESEDFVAGGRYVAAWGHNSSIKEIILTLKIYLEKFEKLIGKVVYLEDHNSEIIGKAIAKELNLEVFPYQQEESTDHCLIVGANTEDFNAYPELIEVQDGQILFALNHSWLAPAVISPDIVGLMSQHYSFPWDGGGFRILQTEEGGIEQTPPDERLADEIANDIYLVEAENRIDEARLAFYLKHKEYIKSIGSKVNNRRFNFMIESPVPGSYFG